MSQILGIWWLVGAKNNWLGCLHFPSQEIFSRALWSSVVLSNGGQKPAIYVTLSWGTTTTTIPRPARQEKHSILREFGVLWNPLTAWAGPGDGGGGGGGGGIPWERDVNSGLLAILRMFLVSLITRIICEIVSKISSTIHQLHVKSKLVAVVDPGTTAKHQ